MKRSFADTEIEEESKIDIEPKTKKQKEFELFIKDISKWTVEDSEIDVMILFIAHPRFIARLQKSIVEAVGMDAHGDKIKLSAWDQDAIRLQRFHELDSVKIKTFRVKKVDQKYQHFHDQSIAIGYKTNLLPISGVKDELLKHQFENHWNFQTLQDVKQLSDNSLVDTAGVLIKDDIISENKRNIVIMDKTSVMQVTLWNAQTKIFLEKQDVIAIAGGKKSSYNNGSLSSVGLIMKNPKCQLV